MAKSTHFLVISTLLFHYIIVLSFSPTNASSSSLSSTGSHTHHHLAAFFDFTAVQPVITTSSSSGGMLCSEGSIEECLGVDEDQYEMESETTRRMLAVRRRYISYGALSRNRVPCSRRGASYYNCRPGAQANPYTRGCSAITRCRRG